MTTSPAPVNERHVPHNSNLPSPTFRKPTNTGRELSHNHHNATQTKPQENTHERTAADR